MTKRELETLEPINDQENKRMALSPESDTEPNSESDTEIDEEIKEDVAGYPYSQAPRPGYLFLSPSKLIKRPEEREAATAELLAGEENVILVCVTKTVTDVRFPSIYLMDNSHKSSVGAAIMGVSVAPTKPEEEASLPVKLYWSTLYNYWKYSVKSARYHPTKPVFLLFCNLHYLKWFLTSPAFKKKALGVLSYVSYYGTFIQHPSSIEMTKAVQKFAGEASVPFAVYSSMCIKDKSVRGMKEARGSILKEASLPKSTKIFYDCQTIDEDTPHDRRTPNNEFGIDMFIRELLPY